LSTHGGPRYLGSGAGKGRRSGSMLGGCPDPPRDHVRATIQGLDKVTKRKKLAIPAELR